jgi:radical SAM superfamily enzyme YgiQ (UPF0313 family)
VNEDPNSPFFLPLGLLCIAATARADGHHVEIIDFEHLHRTGAYDPDEPWIDAHLEPILATTPDIVGFTSLADTLPTCTVLAQEMKRRDPSIVTAVGGPGVFGVFPDLLAAEAGFDYACKGEGEIAITNLCAAVANGAGVPQGFWLRTASGNVVDGGNQSPADLDALPMPAYDLLPMESYIELSTPRIFDLYVGSGCTYQCKFCVTAAFWDRNFRSKSAATIFAEMSYLHDRFGITTFNLLHDNFANYRSYVERFTQEFQELNASRDEPFHWGCAVRPDNVNMALLEKMRAAGCNMIFCGTDAGSPRILREMAKMVDARRIYRFYDECARSGIPFENNTIIGYPGETSDDLEATLEISFDALAAGAANTDLSVLQPLPGAELTLQNLDYLVPVDEPIPGGFVPAEAWDVVERNAGLLTGFFFIQRDNEGFGWYGAVRDTFRYLSRRFTESARALKQRGVRYVDIVAAIIEDRADLSKPASVAEALLSFCPEGSEAAVAIAIDLAWEQLVVGGEVFSEIRNIYREQDAHRPDRPYQLASCDGSNLLVYADPAGTRLVLDLTESDLHDFRKAEVAGPHAAGEDLLSLVVRGELRVQAVVA